MSGSIPSLHPWHSRVEELYDEEAPIAIHGEEKLEYRRMPLNVAQIAICKNDIFRLKEEVTLPSNYPNIQNSGRDDPPPRPRTG